MLVRTGAAFLFSVGYEKAMISEELQWERKPVSKESPEPFSPELWESAVGWAHCGRTFKDLWRYICAWCLTTGWHSEKQWVRFVCDVKVDRGVLLPSLFILLPFFLSLPLSLSFKNNFISGCANLLLHRPFCSWVARASSCGRQALIAVAFLVAEHGLQGPWASGVAECGLRSCGPGL